MRALNLIIIFANSRFDFSVSVAHEEDLRYITREILSPFISVYDKKTDVVTINLLQHNSEELISSLKEKAFELKQIEPQIFKLYSFFANDLSIGENFYLLINTEGVTEQQISEIQYELAKLNNAADSKLIEFVKEHDAKLRRIYNITVYNEKTPEPIGEKNKEKRICRYCKKSMPEVSFKKVAHTISEALGNKKIITNDECDACNQLFGDTIENDLIRVFDFPRFIYRIKGKNGMACKIEGKNYTLFSDPNTVETKLYQINNDGTKEELTSTSKSISLQLIPNRSIPSENIYKCLVKYVIGVLDKDEIKYLGKTIQWIKGETTESLLPPIVKFIDHSIVDHPQMLVCVRKEDDVQDFPHIFVFIRLINTQFAFIIPFSDKDTNDFTKIENFAEVLDWFKLFNDKGWQIVTCDKNEVIIKLKSIDKK